MKFEAKGHGTEKGHGARKKGMGLGKGGMAWCHAKRAGETLTILFIFSGTKSCVFLPIFMQKIIDHF